MVLGLAVFAGLASAVHVVNLDVRRARSLESGALQHSSLRYESLHYKIGLIGSMVISVAAPWCLPAIAFCIYSLVNVGRVRRVQESEYEAAPAEF
jgi:hypothetical protein